MCRIYINTLIEEVKMSIMNIISGIKYAISWVCDHLLGKECAGNSGVQQKSIGGNNNTLIGRDQINIQNQIQGATFDDIINAAIEDLKYNGPYVGTSDVPFKVTALNQLLRNSRASTISAGDKETIREYIRRADQCNSDNTGKFTPGIIQHQMHVMIGILEKYKHQQI